MKFISQEEFNKKKGEEAAPDSPEAKEPPPSKPIATPKNPRTPGKTPRTPGKNPQLAPRFFPLPDKKEKAGKTPRKKKTADLQPGAIVEQEVGW